jgi:hypothetical protein
MFGTLLTAVARSVPRTTVSFTVEFLIFASEIVINSPIIGAKLK